MTKFEKKWLVPLCKKDDNLLSFLCGIFSNVPVSLCLAFTKLYGDLWQRIIFVLTLLLSIFSSAMVVVFALKFTLHKMKYISPNTKGKGPQDVEASISGVLNDKIQLGNKTIPHKTYLKKLVIWFFVWVGILLCTIIVLWLMVNFMSD